jgi:hypothetical protein
MHGQVTLGGRLSANYPVDTAFPDFATTQFVLDAMGEFRVECHICICRYTKNEFGASYSANPTAKSSFTHLPSALLLPT